MGLIGPDLATKTLSAHTNTPFACTNKDLATRTLSVCNNMPLAHTNKDLATRTLSAHTYAHKNLATRTLSARTNTPLTTGSMRTNQDQCVTTSISSVHANTMSTSSVHSQEDLSISSQRALQEEKEEEHSMGTGSDSDAKEDEDSDDGSDSEGDCFSTISIEDDAVQGEEEASLELGIDGSTEGVELRLGEIEEGSLNDVHVELDPANQLKPPKGRSIAHSAFSDQSAVFLSLDIEIGGKHAGIIQLSSEIVRMKLCPGRGVSQDRVEEVERFSTFDSYIKPECNIWDQRCINIHQIHPEDERIVSAHNLENVWSQFKTWLNRHVAMSETIILIAWNRKNCDLKGLWRITQAPRSCLSFPPQIQYFMDPYHVITSFKSCPLNKSNSKLDGYDLGSVWKFVNNGRNLNGAHNSLINVKAQTDIPISQGFVPFIN